MSADLITVTGPVADYIAAKAVEAHGIASHYDYGDYEPIEDGYPLRCLIETVARSAVAVALARLAQNYGLKFTAYQTDQLMVMAVQLDLLAVERDSEPATSADVTDFDQKKLGGHR